MLPLLKTIERLACLVFAMQISLTMASDSIQDAVMKDEPRLFGIFKQLHQNPELAFMEFETASLVAKELAANNFEVISGIGNTGVVGILKNGEGPVVLFRADMDGLPIKEATDLSYKSTAYKEDRFGQTLPVMHACGHDAHTTWLIGMAKQLNQHRDKWAGTAILLAQPAEEIIEGAKAMVADGLYDRIPKPDIIISAHTIPVIPAGVMAIREGRRMAGTDQIDVHIHGFGGHGSTPHATKDPVMMGVMAVQGYQTIVSRMLDQSQPAVLTVGAFQAGDTNNIIPDKATLKVNLRWYNKLERKQLIEGIKAVTDNVAEMYGVPEDRMPEYDMKGYAIPVVNADAADVGRARQAMIKAIGDGRVAPGLPPLMGSEDFQMLAEPFPDARILFIEVGSGKADVYKNLVEKGQYPEGLNHTPKFAVERPAIATGTLALSAVVMEFLSK